MIRKNLNKCKVHDNFLDGEVWIPAENFKVNNYRYFH